MSFVRGVHPLALAGITMLGALCGGMAAAVIESEIALAGKIILTGLCAAFDLGGTWALVSIGRRR